MSRIRNLRVSKYIVRMIWTAYLQIHRLVLRDGVFHNYWQIIKIIRFLLDLLSNYSLLINFRTQNRILIRVKIKITIRKKAINIKSEI